MQHSTQKKTLLHKSAILGIPLGAIALIVYAISNSTAKPTDTTNKIAIKENTTEVARGAAADINLSGTPKIIEDTAGANLLGEFTILKAGADELTLSLHVPSGTSIPSGSIMISDLKVNGIAAKDLTLRQTGSPTLYTATVPLLDKARTINLAGHVGLSADTPFVLGADLGSSTITPIALNKAAYDAMPTAILSGSTLKIETPTGMTLTGLGGLAGDITFKGAKTTLTNTGHLIEPIAIAPGATDLTLKTPNPGAKIALIGKTTSGLPISVNIANAAAGTSSAPAGN